MDGRVGVESEVEVLAQGLSRYFLFTVYRLLVSY